MKDYQQSAVWGGGKRRRSRPAPKVSTLGDLGSQVRGIIVHKLMEEVLTGELEVTLDAVQDRARLLGRFMG
jgi:hypothetical protein